MYCDFCCHEKLWALSTLTLLRYKLHLNLLPLRPTWVNPLIFVLIFSLSLCRPGQVALRQTDTWSMRGWSWGSADPSPSFSSFPPRAPFDQHLPPPFPSFPLPVSLALLDLPHLTSPPPPSLNQPCPMYSPEQENISTTASTKVPVKYGELIVLG